MTNEALTNAIKAQTEATRRLSSVISGNTTAIYHQSEILSSLNRLLKKTYLENETKKEEGS